MLPQPPENHQRRLETASLSEEDQILLAIQNSLKESQTGESAVATTSDVIEIDFDSDSDTDIEEVAIVKETFEQFLGPKEGKNNISYFIFIIFTCFNF